MVPIPDTPSLQPLSQNNNKTKVVTFDLRTGIIADFVSLKSTDPSLRSICVQ